MKYGIFRISIKHTIFFCFMASNVMGEVTENFPVLKSTQNTPGYIKFESVANIFDRSAFLSVTVYSIYIQIKHRGSNLGCY